MRFTADHDVSMTERELEQRTFPINFPKFSDLAFLSLDFTFSSENFMLEKNYISL